MTVAESADAGNATDGFDAGADSRTADGESRAGTAVVRSGPTREDRDAGRLWLLPAGVGCLALIGAASVVAASAVTPSAFAFQAETVRALRSVALVLGLCAGLLGLAGAYARGGSNDPGGESEAVERPAPNPERTRGSAPLAAGARLDEGLAAIADDGVDAPLETYKIERSLRGLAIRVVAASADCSTDRAREHVDRGTWTDDVRAAAFLGGDEAPDRPLQTRLADWASGEAFERQVTATVDELAALSGVDEP